MTYGTEIAPAFSDRREARAFFSNFARDESLDAIDIAYREAAGVAPEAFYSLAARAICDYHYGDERMPSPDAALGAFTDLAYMWQSCRNEWRYMWGDDREAEEMTGIPPDAIDSTHLTGTSLELMFAAALAGARAGGRPISARMSSAQDDYFGGKAAADLELHTPTADYSLQIKSNKPDEDSLRYDLRSVVIVSLPLFARYLRTSGNNPEEKLIPFKRCLTTAAILPELLANPDLADEARAFIPQVVSVMGIFSDALQQYIADRPDIEALHAIRARNTMNTGRRK